MSNLQNIIAENEKELDNELYEWESQIDKSMAFRINRITSLRLIEGLKEMVKNKKEMYEPAYEEVDQAIVQFGDSLLSELNEIK
jgi:hypothetical protein